MILDKQCEKLTTAMAYNVIGPEYYDTNRHPTCANFRDASVHGLRPWLHQYCIPDARILEVGAGKSILLEYLKENNVKVSRLIVTDASPTMLNYSRKIETGQDQLMVAMASCLPLVDHDMMAIVASLGDPYNEIGFWCEAYRVLCPNGHILFTTPSHEWARAFRKDCNGNASEFELNDGRKIYAPSIILEVNNQIDLMRSAGFRTLAIQEVMLDDIDCSRISQKLALEEMKTAPIVRAYLACKLG
jgi:SAM-dependent methyltransferase